MPDKKISALVELVAPDTGDLVPIVDISEAADADKNKYAEFGAFATAAQGALADSAVQPGDNVSGLTNDAGYTDDTAADAAQATADAALPRAGGEMSGNITMAGAQTVDGRDLSADGAKLDLIEAEADKTDAANVDAAGAVMEADFNAHTILAATSDDTPIALAVGEDNLVGRAAGGNIAALTATQARLLLNVEDGATADQTGAEIKALYEGEADTNAFTDAEQTKLGHIAVTQAVDLDAIETRVNALDAAIVLQGTWDASAGTFPGGGTAQAGDSYIVSVPGTVDGVAFSANDRIIAITDNASTATYAANWHKADYTDEVLSVAGLTGAISASGLRTAINVEDGATADQSDAEIATAYQTEVPLISQADAEAGTATAIESWSALRVAQAIAALGGGGSSSAADLTWASGTQSEVSDGASAVAFDFDTDNALSTTGASLLKLSNNGTAAFEFGYDDSQGFSVGPNATAPGLKAYTASTYSLLKLGRKGVALGLSLRSTNGTWQIYDNSGSKGVIQGDGNGISIFKGGLANDTAGANTVSGNTALYLGSPNDTTQRTNLLQADLNTVRDRDGAHVRIKGGDGGATNRSGGNIYLTGGNKSGTGSAGVVVMDAAHTVATLPGTPAVGMVARVTDADTPAVGSTVTGGGAAAAMVWYNGSNWTVTGI